MMKRVARFAKLKGSDGGLPDSPLPECKRKLYAVIGFAPPEEKTNAAVTSPVGDDASSKPAIPIAEGFNLGYCKAKPGKGPLMRLVQHLDLPKRSALLVPDGLELRFLRPPLMGKSLRRYGPKLERETDLSAE